MQLFKRLKKRQFTLLLVEVNEPVRKYINPDKPQDAATLKLLLHRVNLLKSLFFISEIVL
jgi:hypothetical protein